MFAVGLQGSYALVFNGTSTKRIKSNALRQLDNFGLAQIDEQVYLVGGNAAGAVFTLDCVYDQVWESSRMLVARVNPAAVVHDGELYAIGGEKFPGKAGLESLRSVEVISDQEWEYSHPLNKPRKLSSAVSVGRYIYVVGGMNGSESLNSVERYTKTTGWVLMPLLMDIPRSRSGIVALDPERIVLFGGRGVGGARLSNVIELNFEKAIIVTHPQGLFGDFKGLATTIREIQCIRVVAWKANETSKAPIKLVFPVSIWERRQRLLRLQMLVR